MGNSCQKTTIYEVKDKESLISAGFSSRNNNVFVLSYPFYMMVFQCVDCNETVVWNLACEKD